MASLIFKDAEAAKAAIMASQKKEIAKLYEDWADEIGERAKYYSHKSTASAPVSERYYRELQKQLRATSQEVSNEIYKKIKSNIYTVADAVVSDNVKWLESFGFSSAGLNAAFSYVPHEIVQNLITGQIYDSGWSLSSRIWGDNEQTLKDIYQVMAKGLAENKPIYEIAKDLESYVRPSAKLPWNLRMADGKKIYKKQVDYNAQRLARTLVQHGYQQSFIATTQKNPFITEYIWHSNGSRACPLCMERDGVHYKKTELPMDHPNGMCTMEPVVADDMVDQLADWFNSPDGTYPDIDEFAGNFGYKAKKLTASSNTKTEKPKDSVKISDEAKDVAKRYTTGGYKSINEQADLYLSGIPREKAFSKSGSILFDAVNSSTEKFDTLYRIETSSGFVVKDGKVISSPLKKGDQITWGLRSTSKSDKFIGKAAAGKDKNLLFVGEDDFNTKVVYRLRNETGLDVSKISPYKSQQEVIVSGNFEVVTTGTVSEVGGEKVILVDIKRRR